MVITILMLVAVLAVLAGLAFAASGRGGELAPAVPHRPVLDLPPGRALMPTDVERVRFTPTLWGYRPDQVEEVRDRLAGALAERDVRIADLERLLFARRLPAGSTQPLGRVDPEAPTDAIRPLAAAEAGQDTEAGMDAKRGREAKPGRGPAAAGDAATSLDSVDAEEAW